MTSHEVLVKARNLLDKGGVWQQGKPGSGSACSVLAIDDAVRFDAEDERCAANAALAVLCRSVGIDPAGEPRDYVGQVYDWNDSRKSGDEVLAAFDRAIAATAPAPDVSFVAEPSNVEPVSAELARL